MVCPDCKGERITVAAHVRYIDGTGRCNVPMRCLRCKGTGDVDDRTPDWTARGRRCRDKRVHGTPYRNLATVADQIGLPIVAVSRMEMGYADPATLEGFWGVAVAPEDLR